MLVRARVAFMALLFALPAASAACTSTAAVDDAYMALDGTGTRKRNQFYTDSVAIYCVADFASARNNVTLNIRLHQITRFDFSLLKLVPYDAYPVEGELAPGVIQRGQQSIQLIKTDSTGRQNDRLPFPVGNYECQVLVDGNLQKTVPFTIDFPPCPDMQITPNSACFEFYKLGDQCPELGAASKNPIKCTCDAVQGPLSDQNLTGGNWTCDPIQ